MWATLNLVYNVVNFVFPCHDLIVIFTTSWLLYSTYIVVQFSNILEDPNILTLLLEWTTLASYIVLTN